MVSYQGRDQLYFFKILRVRVGFSVPLKDVIDLSNPGCKGGGDSKSSMTEASSIFYRRT